MTELHLAMTPLDKQWVANTAGAECKEDDLTKDSCMVEEEDDNQSDFCEYEDLPEQINWNLSTNVYSSVSAAGMEQWRIMLLGRRGVGKSSTGNTILRQEAFPVNMSLGRTTEFCDRKIGTVDGRPVAVIDTPGLKNAKGGEKKVVREILKNISLYKPGPHVFLFTLPFGNLTRDDIRVLKIIEHMFGKKVWWYTILVFTHGDSLAGTAPSDVISSADKELRDLIRKCSGGFVVFNNKDMGNRAQVTLLMEKIDTMLAVNGNKCYPIEFYPWHERKIRQRQEKHMEERAEDMAQKERQLETMYTSYELEEKKLELWRTTDEELRGLAEKIVLKNKVLGKNRLKSQYK